ncbi:tetratricopeptide repeat protein [Komarekiella sp. 'clone 1']|uniref:protein O-GlcNAc transferase n=1 Tax=Komarekiella delphini-convector SJRDD-AB1 TaxID=2593771 RepID=A0AA40SYJ1_9NOST|nr:tetratricopeptide repeat protein [Komarekiella delphini-convector]MBD6617601.1 tetratricopeptide repeat protein [Komarekiella delphini-convector SJRDD-AB1]
MSDGTALLTKGHYSEAIAYFQEEITKSPNAPEFYFQLGTALALSSQLQEAVGAFQQALQINPEYAEAYSNLGVLFSLQGQVEKAITCYRQAVRLQPNFPEVLNNLGLLLREQGKLDEAISSFREALNLNSNYLEAINNLGLVLTQQGELDEAITLFRQALTLNPDNVDTLNHLGSTLKTKGMLAEAIVYLKQAIQLEPEEAIAHNYLGTIYKDQGQVEEAVVCYRRAIDIDPSYAEAYRNLGLILTRQNQLEEATECLETALKLKPDFPEAFNNLGIICKRRMRWQEAGDYFEQAIELRPHYALAHKNLADIFVLTGCIDKAITSYQEALNLGLTDLDAWVTLCRLLRQQSRIEEALFCSQRGLEQYPKCANLHYAQGLIYIHTNKVDKAVDSLRQALELEPEQFETYYHLGEALISQGRLAEGRDVLRRGYSVHRDPNFRVRRALSLPIILSSCQEIDQERDRLLDEMQALDSEGITLKDPVGVASVVNFYPAYHGRNDRQLQTAIARFYVNNCPNLDWVAPHCKGDRPIKKRWRIGFCSQFLRGHTMGKLYGGILEKLPRDQFEVILLRLPDFKDAMTAKIGSYADSVISLENNLVKARQQIAEQELDLLFYTDIGMAPLSYFLAFARLAPVQCMTWGHPSTTGIPNMDYFLSAEVFESDNAQDHYSEHLIQLKQPGIYYTQPTLPLPASRETFGLPPEGSLYLCPQSSFKFHPEFDQIIGDLLRRDPQGWFVLLEGISSHWDELLRQRWVENIPDVANRICIMRRLSYEEYLQLLILGDVMLDPIHFGGGNTSLEAFAAGLPIVTWPGDYLRSRLTYGFYQQMGLLDCVAWDAKSYIEMAYRLVHDLEWRSHIQQEIQKRASVLYENQAAITEIARFFQLAITAYDCHQTIRTWR